MPIKKIIRKAGGVLSDVGTALETGGKAGLEAAKGVAKTGGRVVVGNLKRASLEITGKMNNDIGGDGPQLRSIGELKPGDILLKQGSVFDRSIRIAGKEVPLPDVMTTFVKAAQSVLEDSGHRYRFAGLLGHAAIYVGQGVHEDQSGLAKTGVIVESVGAGVKEGLLEGKKNTHSHGLRYSDYNWYVVRCKDQRIADKAVEIARKYVNRVEYSKGGLGLAAITFDVTDLTGDPTAVALKKSMENKTPAMFCSEFIAFCLNVATDEVYGPNRRFFDRNQQLVSPEFLYVSLRDHANWEYRGELRKRTRK